MSNIILSVVSPVYMAEKCVDALVNELTLELNKITPYYEIILVDDGSKDKSWNMISNNALKNTKVLGIKLSRNFGQHAAITAGLQYARGKYIVVMDCDLQDNPIYIQELYRQAQLGYEVVLTEKTQRQYSIFKKITGKFFHLAYNFLAHSKDMHSNQNIGAYSLISQKVKNAFLKIKDSHRHYIMILLWLGFRTTKITIEHRKRVVGKSSYSLLKLITHGIDGILSQSNKLLLISIYIGIFFTIIGGIFSLNIIYHALHHNMKNGWASLIVTLIFGDGLILLSIGILGLYIGRIFYETRARPLFLIETMSDSLINKQHELNLSFFCKEEKSSIK